MEVLPVSKPALVAASPWRRRFSLSQDALLIVVSALFFYAHAQHAVVERSFASLFFGTEQALLVVMFLVRRRPLATSTRVWDWTVAAVGGWGALAMRPAETGGPAEGIGIAVQCIGLTMTVFCFLALGKSFGVVAANRGLKVHGPYQFVRHPIYLSHAVTQLGFVVANPSWQNIVVFAVVCTGQCLRIQAEERVLSQTSDYASYKQRVNWRLLPGLY